MKQLGQAVRLRCNSTRRAHHVGLEQVIALDNESVVLKMMYSSQIKEFLSTDMEVFL